MSNFLTENSYTVVQQSGEANGMYFHCYGGAVALCYLLFARLGEELAPQPKGIGSMGTRASIKFFLTWFHHGFTGPKYVVKLFTYPL